MILYLIQASCSKIGFPLHDLITVYFVEWHFVQASSEEEATASQLAQGIHAIREYRNCNVRFLSSPLCLSIHR